MNWDKRHLTGNWEGASSLHGFLLHEERSSFLQASDYKAIPSKLEQLFASCFSDSNAVRRLELFQSNKHRGEKNKKRDFRLSQLYLQEFFMPIFKAVSRKMTEARGATSLCSASFRSRG